MDRYQKSDLLYSQMTSGSLSYWWEFTFRRQCGTTTMQLFIVSYYLLCAKLCPHEPFLLIRRIRTYGQNLMTNNNQLMRWKGEVTVSKCWRLLCSTSWKVRKWMWYPANYSVLPKNRIGNGRCSLCVSGSHVNKSRIALTLYMIHIIISKKTVEY